ncbi:hypothetical protein ACH5RR_040797 [Cinchona calisaya]|uniref:Uncharacterized protein n=1 Tax=Cinchona calisaya TaxID=153742 RepID=A0ABD2XV75_9GENT
MLKNLEKAVGDFEKKADDEVHDVRTFSPNGNSTVVSRNIGSTAISGFNSKASGSSVSNMANKIEPNCARRF